MTKPSGAPGRAMRRASAAMALALIAGPMSPGVVLATPETDRALDQVKALGKRWDGEVNVKTRDIYVPLHKASRKDGVKVTRDVRYGPFERNRLDVVEPLNKPAKPMPVVIYVHGGGLTGGDKDSPGTPAEGLIYTNVGTYFAHHGMLGIVLVRLGVAEINENAVAQESYDRAFVLGDRFGAVLLIGVDDLRQIFRVEASR